MYILKQHAQLLAIFINANYELQNIGLQLGSNLKKYFLNHCGNKRNTCVVRVNHCCIEETCLFQKMTKLWKTRTATGNKNLHMFTSDVVHSKTVKVLTILSQMQCHVVEEESTKIINPGTIFKKQVHDVKALPWQHLDIPKEMTERPQL